MFNASISPKLSEVEVRSGVELLFDLLDHRVGDRNLDGIGTEILDCLIRRCRGREHVRIADRFEPFAKFVLRIAFPARYSSLVTKHRNRFTLAEVLKELKLAEEEELRAWSRVPWHQFPPPDLPGKQNFKEQVGWTVRFRNTEDHVAPELDNVKESKLIQSVCVCLVWLTAKHEQELRLALITSTFSDHLERVQRDLKDIADQFVELTTEPRSSEEYRLLDPLGHSPTATPAEVQTEASKLANVNQVTVIEADPGAGKTTTLQFVAWQQAEGLLSRQPGWHRIPVYVELKLLSHRRQTIEDAVQQQLRPADGVTPPIPWDSLLVLVDGVNEVVSRQQTAFKAEIRDLLSRSTRLRVVLAGRPNSFRGEFEARIVVLQRLSDEQLANLFQRVFDDAARAGQFLTGVRHSSFLSQWVRTPLHAVMVARIAHPSKLDTLTNHSEVVRHCIRGLLGRERDQASAEVIRTDSETKELLLAYLAFETKRSKQAAFSRTTARSLLASAKAKAAAPSLDISKFLEEVRDNHLLKRGDQESMEFAHELYHDYFAATELEAREQLKAGLGVEFALAHFSDPQWGECIRLFAGFSKVSRILVERGAEQNPMLAWQLLRDAGGETPELLECVSDSAYCALSKDLRSAAEATLAAGCIFVLADLGRADLLERAITEQREVFEPKGQKKWTGEQKAKQKQVALPLTLGLLLLVRFGLGEQKSGQEGRFCQAGRAALHGLERIKAARVLCAMLSAWTGTEFLQSALIPGVVLNTLISIGVDHVLKREDELMTRTLAAWLKRASEAGHNKAWPAYGRVLRLARRPYVADTGQEFDGDAALIWLRQSHEAGDSKGTLELALLLLEEPEFAKEFGEGERMLRELAATNLEARYELGYRLLKGENLPKNETEGFEHLLFAAESGHADARREVENVIWAAELGVTPPQFVLPSWAKPHVGRLKVLFPRYPIDLR